LQIKIFSFQKQKILFSFRKQSFRKCFLNKNVFVFKKNIFVSETLPLLFRKHFVNQIENKSHQFSGRGPCVPPCVDGQCFHLRRLDLQILLYRCLAPVARDHIARTCRLIWVFPCCGNLSLGKFLWGICDVRLITCCLEQVNGIFLAKRSGWIGRTGMVVVMQSVSTGIC